MKKGLLIVFSGPSGVGKGTIIKRLMEQKELRLCYSVSMTTRQKREGEKEGVNYFFVSEEEFKQAVYNGELLEHAVFVDKYSLLCAPFADIALYLVSLVDMIKRVVFKQQRIQIVFSFESFHCLHGGYYRDVAFC